MCAFNNEGIDFSPHKAYRVHETGEYGQQSHLMKFLAKVSGDELLPNNICDVMYKLDVNQEKKQPDSC